ncbi:hypothetical protein PSTT_00482 [Puccinia striiformis]|uniref:CN hydrolase domain-containing protein n=1 Tax=Puccinia striiformis TaxID=27350 RepID=A0A2S4W790_9BASI|nr:hypothetical protein PSTT_00482 [Puccinia striiformis]
MTATNYNDVDLGLIIFEKVRKERSHKYHLDGMVLCAVGQLCSSRGNVIENLIRCRSIISRSAKAGAKVDDLLPEASDYIVPASQSPSLAQSLDGSEFVKAIQSSAQENDCWVSVGVHEKSTEDPKRSYNTSLIISNQGIVQQAYRKLHLFDIDLGNSTSANESKYIIPGKKIEEPFPTPIGMVRDFFSQKNNNIRVYIVLTHNLDLSLKVGQLICYDLRFPEVALIHRRRGADILIYPSAFTMRTGGSHWETLLRARAIETQLTGRSLKIVLRHCSSASRHSYRKPLRQSWGHAMIIDPWGTILSQVPDVLPSLPPPSAEEDPEWSTSFALADIDSKSLELIRKSMPILNQRRNDIYPRLD